jgi:hypothetical protein
MTDPVKGHNKGPIGPLDPDQPPPAVPILKRHHRLRAQEAVEALRSMGSPITERDLEYYHSIGEGPPHAMAPGQREYTWGHVLDWTAHTFPAPMNRKQATKYICEELGHPIGPTVLSQLIYTPGRGPRYINQGRDTYYTKEALEEWVKEDRARGPRHSTAPKYLPLYAKRRCPRGYEHLLADESIPVKLLLAAWGGKPPPPEHKECPWVKHEKCAKYPRALCNLIHLPLDPALFADYEKRGIIRLLRTKRPDDLDIKAYLRDWTEGRGGPRVRE